MKVYIALLSIFLNATLFCMDQLCFKEIIFRDNIDPNKFETFECLQKKSICNDQNSCCYNERSCCEKKIKCCKNVKRKGCCGDPQHGCTTNNKKIAVIKMTLHPSLKITSMENVTDEVFIRWIIRRARDEQKADRERNQDYQKRFVNIYGAKGRPALCIAAQQGLHRYCRELLQLGADVNKPIQNSLLSPLHVAKTTNVLKVLLQTGKANIEQKCSSGYTPLFYQVSQKSFNRVRFLLDNKADITYTLPGKDKRNLLHQALMVEASDKLISLLLKKNKHFLSKDTDQFLNYMTEGQIKPFEPYGFMVFDLLINSFQENAETAIQSLSQLFFEAEEENEGFLDIYTCSFGKMVEVCQIKNSDFSKKQLKRQFIKKNRMDYIVCRYPSYELLSEFFGQYAIDLLLEFDEKWKKEVIQVG